MVKIEFFGHTTVLLDFAGQRLILDPNFSLNIPWVKRSEAPSFDPFSLAKTNTILFTNAHYHRLDLPSLKYFPLSTQVITPAAVGQVVKNSYPFHITELNDKAKMTTGEVDIYAYKALHHATRGLNLMCHEAVNYVIKGPGLTACYLTDTRYEGLYFYEIGQKHNIDVAFIPIDNVGPDTLARSRFLGVPKALQAFLDLGAKSFVPVCYGAFNFSHRDRKKLLMDLETSVQKLGLTERIKILAPGECVMVNSQKN